MSTSLSQYSKKKLLTLISTSPAYTSLSPGKKADISAHLKASNTPVLKYIYYTLLEEQQIENQAQEELAEKVFKISHQKALNLSKNLSKSLS